MTSPTNIEYRIKESIIKALELELNPEDIQNDMELFGAEQEGGLGLDSLSALEIVVALSREFQLMPTEVNPSVFRNVSTLSDYIRTELSSE